MIRLALTYLIHLPLLSGALLLLVKKERLKKGLAQGVFFISLAWSIFLLILPSECMLINLFGDVSLMLGLNKLSGIILVFVNLFAFLISLYSQENLKEKGPYFSYLFWLIAFCNLVLFSNNFITFIFGWGATLVLLYAFLSLGSGQNANKAFSVVGVADFALILGVCFYIAARGGQVNMPLSEGRLYLNTALNWFSFILFLIGALAKAGCGPFHTWIPQASETSSMPVMAILPASLDKLLGIYLLSRICVDFFVLGNLANALLLIIGSLTIIFAVMMALVQHDLRKLLSYHAISQVGYMVLGFGTGVPVGILGGIFHMINNAIYKSGLFLTAGIVGQERKTFELDRLGNLAVYMPVTFIAGLIFSLSISGVPPFNGFASKWLIYQGAILGLFATTNIALRLIYIFALVSAMFGSALTLASFIKLLHSVFLGQDNSLSSTKPREPSLSSVVPLLVLAMLCVVLGVMPKFFIKSFIEPWLAKDALPIGSWNSLLAFIVLSLGLLSGLVYLKFSQKKIFREDNFFIGTEYPDPVGTRFPATEFYRTIEEMPLIKKAYCLLKIGALDFYNILSGALRLLAFALFLFVDRLINLLNHLVGSLVMYLSWALRKAHTGVLDFYLAWSLFGLIVLFFILMVR